MAFIQEFIDTIQQYPTTSVKLEIVNVEVPGDALNESETGEFQVKVTNSGALDMNGVTVHVFGENGVRVRSNGVLSPPVSDFVTVQPSTIKAGSSVLIPDAGPGSRFKLIAPSDPQPESTLVRVTLDNWDAGLDSLLKNRSKGGSTPQGTYSAEVVGL